MYMSNLLKYSLKQLNHIYLKIKNCLFSACGLSIKSIFSQPFNKRLDAYTQKLSWANYSCSDPIAYISPYQVLIFI